MKKLNLLCGALISVIGLWAQGTGPLVLNTPADYQVTALSDNGKWACGTYTNGNNMTYAFRWDLTTGQTILLSGDDVLSQADNVSDDGVVVGQFDNTQATENGAPIFTAGYWKDGSWHHLPNINDAYVANQDRVGYAYAITPDGKYIAGAYNDAQSICIPVVWEDGKVKHTFGGTGYDGMIYGLSKDGQKAVGWTINKESEGARVATLWEVGKGATLLMDSQKSNAWCSGRTFSPNGRLILYWEGYYDYTAEEKPYPESANMGVIAIYDTETGKKQVIPNLKDYPLNFDVYDITDAGTVVGYEQFESDYVERAFIYKDGKTRFMEDYLKENGVDIDAQKQILMLEDSTAHHLFRGVGISADEKTLAVLYYDTIGAIRSMVVKFDENVTTREPVLLQATALQGVPAIRLSWQVPLAGADAVKGYNLYRDGVKLNNSPLSGLEYVDTTGLTYRAEAYTYQVKAVYANTESAADTATLVLTEREVSAPRDLFARQASHSDVIFRWQHPSSNLIAKSYFNEAATISGFGGGENAFEAAIRLKSAEMAVYDGYQMRGVVFYPLSKQERWILNLYFQPDGSGEKQVIYTQDLTETIIPGTENIVTFDTPILLPQGGDIYVAFSVTPQPGNTSNEMLGQVYGDCLPGYSDLARMLTEPTLYSLYNASLTDSYTYTMSWAVSLLLAPATLPSTVDQVASYRVYDGETQVGETQNSEWTYPSLAAGTHELGIRAVYTDGRISPLKQKTFEVVPNEDIYKGIERPVVTLTDQLSIRATWEEPKDDDETFITYASTTQLQGGVLGPSESNYGYMAATIYPADRLRGYGGYKLTGVRFYPLVKADFTFYLKQNGEVIVSDLYAEDYVPNQWNFIPFKEPILLDEKATYQLELDCWDVPIGQAPLGIDALPPFMGYSDLYSLDEGSTFTSVVNASAYGNWMMGLVLESPAPRKLPIKGYDVYIDGQQANTSLLSEPHFNYTFPTEDADAHRLRVDVHYDVKGQVSGGNTFFYIGASTVDEAVYSIDIDGQGGYVVVEGAGVTSLAAYSLSGTLLATAEGNRLELSGLPSGVIILQATRNGKKEVYKLSVTNNK